MAELLELEPLPGVRYRVTSVTINRTPIEGVAVFDVAMQPWDALTRRMLRRLYCEHHLPRRLRRGKR